MAGFYTRRNTGGASTNDSNTSTFIAIISCTSTLAPAQTPIPAIAPAPAFAPASTFVPVSTSAPDLPRKYADKDL